MITKLWRRLPARGAKGVPEGGVAGGAVADADSSGTLTKSRYINREISDLQFIERVVEEALNPLHPLLERLRFLAISASVLDQFYAVRVAKLKRGVDKLSARLSPDGLTPNQQLALVTRMGSELMSRQQNIWSDIRAELKEVGIQVLEPEELGAAETDWLRQYFHRHVEQVLTPITIDEEHPFPFIPSGGVCSVLEFEDQHILIPLPENLPRFVPIPGASRRFVLMEDLIVSFWTELIDGDPLQSHGLFQILRDNDLAKQERSDDLRARIESGLKLRHKANVIRLKVTTTMSPSSVGFIARQLSILSDDEIMLYEEDQKSFTDSEFIVEVDLPGLGSITGIITDEVAREHYELLFEPHSPYTPPQLDQFEEDCFAAISRKDLLVHWPYEPFDSVVQFLYQAARDPQVLAIKQTLYRTNDDSPIVDALIAAALAGKTVTTIIELEARDNESSNVQLAKRLEAAGVQIIYGIVGLKIHCKATLVVRREDEETVTYSHFSTGNYHPVNARTYTDLSFFTRDPQLGADANLVFNYLTSGHYRPPQKLIVAPRSLRSHLYSLIDNEIAHAQSGAPAHIYIKINSLTDPDIIERLYAASEAGVEVDLVVRRHCSLRPGIDGMSSRIRVKSIVGRFLEHSRIFLFANGGALDADSAGIYIGSADLMERNLDERVETLVPIEDVDLRRRIVHEILHANVRDTRQSWILTGDDRYHRHADAEGFCTQSYFMQPDREPLGPLAATIDTEVGSRK